ncbi:MAG: ATP-binding cassette domain-containing protein [Fidelibacterota bacterium]
MIKVTNLSKNFGTVEAVKAISFEIERREIVGFLGANGAGKTTTLRMIAGYLAPTSGTAEVNGVDIQEDLQTIQKQIGYLPEFNPLYPEMSVYDYLRFIGDIRNLNGKQFQEALSRVIEQCGLKGVVHRHIGNCSKGYKQRIGLAAAMIHDPKIIILDEPVTGLDPNQIVETRELIKELGKEKLVLLSSHILQEIQATVDRIIIIHNGEIVADGTSDELMASFMGNVLMSLEVKNATSDAIEKLPQAIPAMELLRIEERDNYHRIQLEYNRDEDPREELFKYAVDSNWILLKMNPQDVGLEDVFRNLTATGGADA